MKCAYCGSEFVPKNKNQVNCSAKCRNRKHNNTSKKSLYVDCNNMRGCIICNKPFTPRQWNSKFCSDKCRNKNDNQREDCKQKRREYVKAHRKRYEGILIDSDISLFKLANRDKQQCQICGLLIDWTDKKEIDGYIVCGEMYPSIDHITPISLGGKHEWTNVQLAHRICNSRKSNKYIG